jgi:hypothetical protein
MPNTLFRNFNLFHRSFTRVTRGPENGAYYHPLFQKDNLQLCTGMRCIDSKASQAIQPMSPVALGLTASPFAHMYMVMVDPNNLNSFPQESHASQSLPREWNLLPPPSFPTGQPPTMYANELHTFQGKPSRGDSTDGSCCARADGEPIRADEHDDGGSEQPCLDGLDGSAYSMIGKSSFSSNS